MVISVLDREMFIEAEAARLLQVAPSTLHYWLEGGTRRGKRYPPVIRTEPRDTRTVTWAEFVEAGLLREYRRKLQVPMFELRNFIDRLREELGRAVSACSRKAVRWRGAAAIAGGSGRRGAGCRVLSRRRRPWPTRPNPSL